MPKLRKSRRSALRCLRSGRKRRLHAPPPSGRCVQTAGEALIFERTVFVVEGAISTKVGKSSAGYKRKKIGVARIAHKVLRPCTYPKTTWLVPPGGAWMRVVERPVMTLPQF